MSRDHPLRPTKPLQSSKITGHCYTFLMISCNFAWVSEIAELTTDLVTMRAKRPGVHNSICQNAILTPFLPFGLLAPGARAGVRGKRVVVLDIPDNYGYMEPALVELIKRRCAQFIAQNG